MSNIWGVSIPGLAMAADELPEVPGCTRFDNPEIGAGPVWNIAEYSLAQVAEMHAKRIALLRLPELTVIGMSMGGMIVAIMASAYRSLLPSRTKFRVLVSSPNTKANPAITDAMLASWRGAKPGSVADFERILNPFFGQKFAEDNPERVQAYYSYRAFGGNKQTGKGFYRQVAAIRSFEGAMAFSGIDPKEITIIGGSDDQILGPNHTSDLRNILPSAQIIEVKGLGHMVNIEIPSLFQKDIAP